MNDHMALYLLRASFDLTDGVMGDILDMFQPQKKGYGTISTCACMLMHARL